MTTIPIPSGPTYREIIDRAYQMLGLSDSMFGRTPEEYASAILPVQSLLLEWPYDQLGADIEDAAGLRPEQESGIARKYLDTVAYGLAERMAPTIGKELSGAASKVGARLYSNICADFPAATDMVYPDATPRGRGNRFGTFWPANP